MTHWIRESVGAGLGIAPDRAGLEVVYDVCHNIAKFETFTIEGRTRRLCVHRKGATRAYPNQPVLIPGDMGRYSYVMVGSDTALAQTFGSACHGAGRLMSRSEAKRAVKGRSLIDEMRARRVEVMAAGIATVAEEMPEAYKDVSDVVNVVHGAGVATRVAQLRPLGVIKG
jgi:tRNA-splicing ligase RtcB